MLLALCITSAACAASLAVLLLRTCCSGNAARWPLWKLWLATLLVVPGHILPPILLWQAWRHIYFVIPFLGPPFRVGMAAVAWAGAAVALSYTSSFALAWKAQWAWMWVVLHPYCTVRELWRGWRSYCNEHAG